VRTAKPKAINSLETIIYKAQGRTESETGREIDIGGEVASLRREFDNLMFIARKAWDYARAQECVCCRQHRVYTHLPNCELSRLAHREGWKP